MLYGDFAVIEAGGRRRRVRRVIDVIEQRAINAKISKESGTTLAASS